MKLPLLNWKMFFYVSAQQKESLFKDVKSSNFVTAAGASSADRITRIWVSVFLCDLSSQFYKMLVNYFHFKGIS